MHKWGTNPFSRRVKDWFATQSSVCMQEWSSLSQRNDGFMLLWAVCTYLSEQDPQTAWARRLEATSIHTLASLVILVLFNSKKSAKKSLLLHKLCFHRRCTLWKKDLKYPHLHDNCVCKGGSNHCNYRSHLGIRTLAYVEDWSANWLVR